MPLLRASRGTGITGAVIRWATWSRCDHVGFKLDDGLVLDATPEFGVALRVAQDDETTSYYRFNAPAIQLNAAIRWASLQIGSPYDWSALFGFAIRRDWHRTGCWFCSELVEAAMAQAGCSLLRDGGKLDRITPRDLLMSPLITPTSK